MSDASKTRSVIVEREISFPPEKIWRALTEPHLIEEWLMKNDFQPVVGQRFNFRATPVPNRRRWRLWSTGSAYMEHSGATDWISLKIYWKGWTNDHYRNDTHSRHRAGDAASTGKNLASPH